MFDFIKGKISEKYIRLIKKSFYKLPDDKYLKFVNENFRKRKFSKTVFSNGLFHTIKENNFIQNKIQNNISVEF